MEASPWDDEQARAAVASQAAIDPSVASMQIEFLRVTAEGVHVRMPVRDGMRNAFGIVQGGFSYLLGDSAFAFTSAASGTAMVTHHANVTYVAPASGAWLEARGAIQHRYGRNAVVEVEVLDEGVTPVCLLTLHGVAAKRPAPVAESGR